MPQGFTLALQIALRSFDRDVGKIEPAILFSERCGSKAQTRNLAFELTEMLQDALAIPSFEFDAFSLGNGWLD